jgi:hypothetical protein
MVFDGIAYPNPDQVALGGLHPNRNRNRERKRPMPFGHEKLDVDRAAIESVGWA